MSTSIPADHATPRLPSDEYQPPGTGRTQGSGFTGWLRGLRWWVIVISVLGVSAILYFVIRVQGHVFGEEFSPSHFQQRSFEFYEIPLLHLQLTPVQRASRTSRAGTYIRQQGLISIPSGQPTDWHLVSIQRGIADPTTADAQLLTDQLQILTSDSFWKLWSDSHPPQAAILWPIVQRTAQRELYVLIPRMLELAMLHADSTTFAAVIDSYLIDQYAALVREARAAQQTELADELLEEALLDYPDDNLLRSL